eukprot:CAMPEP_0194210044 /NCGR_PEP_ID=MMETSP0156-20130528/7968_1 /TAXON_ID=33649 /ORGANISM="Thalassionema nitzschioides, Strain L26-B" /LENGTH=253 /DNA_ID=CAMNT_0038937329 /DNA_START=165 /DNA_END=923 /DNA_ORIENTATION=+
MGKNLEQTTISLPSLESEREKARDDKTNKSGDSLTDHLQEFHKDLFERRRARQRNVNTKKINKTLDALDNDSFSNLDTLNLSTGNPTTAATSFIRDVVNSTAAYDAPPWVVWWNELLPKLKSIRRKVTSRRFIHTYGPYMFLLIIFTMVILSIRVMIHSHFSASEAALAASALQQQEYSDTDVMSLKAFSDTSLLLDANSSTNKEVKNGALPNETHEENMRLRGNAATIEQYEKMLAPSKAWRPRKYGENQYH